MRTSSTWLSALLACSLLVLAPEETVAQPNGLNPGRDCQSLLTCRFTRGGIYRGCLSSYSCRVCRLVATRCRIDPGSRVCQQLQCTWG
jgi:hypothetical protein